MSGRLEGKRAIVTGAGHGQGREVALGFARSGATVLAVDLDEPALKMLEEAAQADGLPISTQACDVSAKDDVLRVVRRAEADWGTWHVLYNNAGITRRGDGPSDRGTGQRVRPCG